MIRTLIALLRAWHRANNACQTCDQREGMNLDCPECDDFNKMMGIVVLPLPRATEGGQEDGK